MALYDDPLDAARKRMFPQQVGQSFFPAVNQQLSGVGNLPPLAPPMLNRNTPAYPTLGFSFGLNNMRLFGERDDLLQNIDQTFYGGGQVQPTPTPTPTPRPRSYFGGGYLNTTGFQGNVPTMTPPRQFNFGLGMNRRFQNTFEEWQKRYGFNA